MPHVMRNVQMPLAKWNIEATMPTMYSAKNTGFATMSAIMEKPGSTPNSACTRVCHTCHTKNANMTKPVRRCRKKPQLRA